MTSLVAVSSHLPGTVPVDALKESLGLDDQQVRRFTRLYGLNRICRAPDQREAELLLAAAGKLEGLAGMEDRIRYVIRAKGLRTTAPYPISPLHEVRDALGLRDAKTFAVADHGCATGLLAIDVAGMLLEADGDPDALALVLAGDKTLTPFSQWVADVSIMGEATAAVLVGPGGGRDRMLGYAARLHGREDGLIDLVGDLAKEAVRIYQDALAEVVAAALEEAGITVADIDLVLPHNVNRVSWTVAAKNLGIPGDKIYLGNIEATGHSFCADPFINYQSARERGLLKPGDHYLMTSAGLGQSFAAMVFQH
ncbi:3-oxoacyl-[acyl-carrier-protein] synthase III C-terminal domain-containing protein [Streptomyces sp. NPDC054949]|uniref:3-oxoacyl-[acyl-carrier-protein] synthase III C-terminal domain-containing protein n=1 Tax=unclassified Streptomyces TaxID=2593676 RepID=UPI00224F4B27|nr:3-oxoacyl-[acyl-carrier-protein] synthase III C-terminal domain-containing protein [Streptomyces sp. NBC_00424]MCX5077870.1 3-oxoacyl-ACP synthase [Streptomyces sp. NBC_00424]